MSWKRPTRGINNAYRMDKHVPPAAVPVEKVPRKQTWRKKFACYVAKGDHEFELIKPSYTRDNEHLLSVEEYYARADKQTEERNAELQERFDAYQVPGVRKYRFFMSRKWRYWKCVHCGKRGFDSEEQPDKKVRKYILGNGVIGNTHRSGR